VGSVSPTTDGADPRLSTAGKSSQHQMLEGGEQSHRSVEPGEVTSEAVSRVDRIRRNSTTGGTCQHSSRWTRRRVSTVVSQRDDRISDTSKHSQVPQGKTQPRSARRPTVWAKRFGPVRQPKSSGTQSLRGGRLSCGPTLSFCYTYRLSLRPRVGSASV
jgi:hypothetical protein